MARNKNLFDIRFAVRRPDGFQSSIWRAWGTRRGDVYLAVRRMASIEKISFHVSRICRRAFTAEHGTPGTMEDRLMYRWGRGVAPDAVSGQATSVAWFAFPTDFLSRRGDGPAKPVNWIDAAPARDATYLNFAFTKESEQRINELFAASGRRIVHYATLPSGEAFFIDRAHSDWENRDLKVPGEGKVNDLLFSANDPLDTGRPIRLSYGPIPADGDALKLIELGGYAIES